MRLNFKVWNNFAAVRKHGVTTSWLNHVRDLSLQIFRKGMTHVPHTGRIYSRSSGLHKASAPGEYPANESGRLLGSTEARTTGDTVRIGTNAPHALYLVRGTSKMRKRKMYKEALREGIEAAGKPIGWVKWSRTRV